MRPGYAVLRGMAAAVTNSFNAQRCRPIGCRNGKFYLLKDAESTTLRWGTLTRQRTFTNSPAVW
ncbi:hypothetical protein A4R26_21700 [Niastella populi]|uniref:Uncharacterized protein n=1 Tax=Niastella populi TaxID=550983 RepID=A0A1V9FL39_9BACT|nr:hypothetical protein A4R26_21700 [Niastella populi]